MSKLKYPNGKYDAVILYVSYVLFVAIAAVVYFNQGYSNTLLMVPFFGVLWLALLYKLKTNFLYIDDDTVHLDQGLIRRKLKVLIVDIKTVHSYKLNNEIIGIVFKLNNTGTIEYKAPYPNYYSTLKDAKSMIEDRLQQKKTNN